MHVTEWFGRTSALDADAQQSSTELIFTFERELATSFKDEVYRVRDNGAIFRCKRPERRIRPRDETWTFGTLNRHSGYLELNGHVVHRIVATAFKGSQPSAGHVVDHIDTNRLNNRADNLRWVTRLGNILLNPITRKRIELSYGSLEAFFADPQASSVPNWEWMRTVTKDEAEQSRKRLLAWAETGQVGGGMLGDWVFKAGSAEKLMPVRVVASVPAAESQDVPSLTPNAFQRKWRTPTEFPYCPAAVEKGVQSLYLEGLSPGAVFSRNRYGDNIVVEAALSQQDVLSIVCSTPPNSVKGWAHATVYIEGEAFCHESGGMFFSQDGAMKAHCIAIGAPYDQYDDSIDDYC